MKHKKIFYLCAKNPQRKGPLSKLLDGISPGLVFSLFFLSVIIALTGGCSYLRKAPNSAIDNSAKKVTPKKAKFIKASDFKEDKWALENYLIDMGDILEISVWQVEDLQRDVVVRPDGKISFPLIGDIQASGKTIEQLREEVVDKIKEVLGKK